MRTIFLFIMKSGSSLQLQLPRPKSSMTTEQIKPPSSQAGRLLKYSIGIGGPSLRPQFVFEALASDNPPLKIRFIDNTDPAGIDHQIAQPGEEIKSTLVILISKSGGTPETRNGLLEVQKAFRDAGLDFSKQRHYHTARGLEGGYFGTATSPSIWPYNPT